ncbi:MAG: hypothetical protein ABI211_20110, partial [Vicinamibacterales bacterium]
FALWVNLHGGWIVGIGVFGLWSAVALSPWRRGTTPARRLAAAVAITFAATLLNPYGAELWSFLGQTVRVDRPNINDWRPLIEAGLQVILPWLMTAAMALVALVRGGRGVPLAHVALAVGLGLASIKVSRLDVFFSLTVATLLAPHLPQSRIQEPVRPAWTRRTVAAAVILLLLLGSVSWRSRAELACVRLDGPWMPERQAGALVASRLLTGRMLSWFDWGQYVIWHAGPRLQVSMDGRRETVYSDAFVARHMTLYFQPDQELALLTALNADVAWLPADLPLTAALDRSGWQRQFAGPRSVVLSRLPMTFAATSPVENVPGCFPGP